MGTLFANACIWLGCISWSYSGLDGVVLALFSLGFICGMGR